MSVPNFELPLAQGADWRTKFHWYAGGTFRAPIEEIDQGYPTRIRVTAHGLPSISSTPVIISGVEGMTVLNSKDTGVELADYVDDDHFNLPVSTVAQEWCVGSGEMTWYLPTDITGYTARCQIRKRWHSSTFEAELTTENGGITLTTEDAGIELYIDAATSAAFTFDKAVFDVEMISAGGDIVRVVQGVIEVSREVTR